MTRNDGTEMKRRDGSPVRFVSVAAVSRPELRLTVDEGFTGPLPTPGDSIRMQLQMWEEPVARQGERGAYVAYQLKTRLVAWASENGKA
jgi:hypothetical protein